MKIVLIRHGQSVGNTKAGYISGAGDPDGLTVSGRSQVARLIWELRARHLFPDRIVTSPVKRAAETAALIGQAYDLSPISQPFLSELHHGIFERRYWWEIVAELPPLWREQFRQDYTVPYPQGESFYDLAQRVHIGFRQLLTEASSLSQSVLFIVSHDAVIGTLQYLLEHEGQLPTDSQTFLTYLHHHVIGNSCALIFSTTADSWRLEANVSLFPPLSPDSKSLRLYAQSHYLTTKTAQITSVPSVSINAVYKISGMNHTSHMIKIVNQRDSITAIQLKKLYDYLQRHHIPVPHITLIDKSGVFFEKPVVVQDYVEGYTQSECLRESSSTHLYLELREILSCIHHIHQLPVSEVKEFWEQGHKQPVFKSNWKEYLLHQINLARQALPACGLSGIQPAIEHQLNQLQAYVSLDTYNLVPLHGDLSPQNLLLTDNGRCYLLRILDFERARIGDRVWDVAYYHGWLERANPAWAEVLVRLLKEEMSSSEMTAFWWYRTLFHCWTVRDERTYPDDLLRQEAATGSRKILFTTFLPAT